MQMKIRMRNHTRGGRGVKPLGGSGAFMDKISNFNFDKDLLL